MNEVQLIRQQLAAEREHAGEIAAACARVLGRPGAEAPAGGSALGEFREACVEYMVRVLAWFEERDRRLAELWSAPPSTDGARRALEEVLARRGRSREALEKLEAALATRGSTERIWQEFAGFFDSVWSSRRDAIDQLLARQASTADWRLVAGIDADSILEERRRYARVRQTLPPGESLGRQPSARKG